MLIDANLLLYATDSSSVHHERSARPPCGPASFVAGASRSSMVAC